MSLQRRCQIWTWKLIGSQASDNSERLEYKKIYQILPALVHNDANDASTMQRGLVSSIQHMNL